MLKNYVDRFDEEYENDFFFLFNQSYMSRKNK